MFFLKNTGYTKIYIFFSFYAKISSYEDKNKNSQ